MTPFRTTLLWVLATVLGIYLLVTAAGYIFVQGMENAHAKTILSTSR